MSFTRSLYDRIIDLSDVFANHFNNLLAIDFQEESVQVGQDDNQGQWRQVERGRRTNRADPLADQARRESLAQRLTLDTAATSMHVHSNLFNELLKLQFESPCMDQLARHGPISQFRSPVDTYGHCNRYVACPLDSRMGTTRRMGQSYYISVA